MTTEWILTSTSRSLFLHVHSGCESARPHEALRRHLLLRSWPPPGRDGCSSFSCQLWTHLSVQIEETYLNCFVGHISSQSKQAPALWFHILSKADTFFKQKEKHGAYWGNSNSNCLQFHVCPLDVHSSSAVRVTCAAFAHWRTPSICVQYKVFFLDCRPAKMMFHITEN